MMNFPEAEQTVIGTLLTDKLYLDDVVDLLNPVDFSVHENAVIWKAITTLHENGHPIDPLTITKELGDHQYFGTLMEIVRNTVSTKNVMHYAQIIADGSMRRTAKLIGHQITEYAEIERNAPLVAEKANELVSSLDRATDSDLQRIGDLCAPAIERITGIMEGKVDPMGNTTGIPDLDHMTTGLHPGKLYVIAGRPGQGKTAFAVWLATQSAKSGQAAFFASLEMGKAEIANRFISCLGGLDGRKVKNPVDLTDMENDQLMIGLQQMKELPVIVSDDPMQTAQKIRANAKRAKRMHGKLGLIVVDYLQLMQGSKSAGNREQEVSQISRSMKILAKEMECPVLLLSQLNRGVEQRPDKRPMMSDLRESGSIEQDADVVIMLYRDEYYKPDTIWKGIGEIIIRKQRDGETGTVYSYAQMATNRYLSVTPETIERLHETVNTKFDRKAIL